MEPLVAVVTVAIIMGALAVYAIDKSKEAKKLRLREEMRELLACHPELSDPSRLHPDFHEAFWYVKRQADDAARRKPE